MPHVVSTLASRIAVRKIHRMESPTLALQSVSADLSEFGRVELEAFVATSKRQRPCAWARVEQLQEACRRESLATAADLHRAERVLEEQSSASSH